MNVGPVMVRELRAQSRQPFTYHLRALGVLALLIAGGIFGMDYPFGQDLGGHLFTFFHGMLFGVIWILVPLSAADCISRERREGTLGLLFLTPLRPVEIAMAKGIVHGLRGLTLLVAVIPVVTICFLLGGLNWSLAGASLLINLAGMCWALAAGVLGSACAKSALRAKVLAILFALIGFYLFTFMLGAALISVASAARPAVPPVIPPGGVSGFAPGIVNAPGRYYRGYPNYDLQFARQLGFGFATMSGPGYWGGFSRSLFSTLSPASVLTATAITGGLSVGVLLAVFGLAALQMRCKWREEPPPVWMQKCEKKFCTPVLWRGFFQRWMRKKLDQNPIGWLEQRTWVGRLVTWSWFAVIVSIYSAVLTDDRFFRTSEPQIIMGWLLMGSLAASVAGSFRRERESGVLELLLVSPLAVPRIISGRLRGLWGQFLPAVVLLLGVWCYFIFLFKHFEDFAQIVGFLITFITLPAIGLYFSLRCRSYIGAFLTTLAMGIAVPMILEVVLIGIWDLFSDSNHGRSETDLDLHPQLIAIQILFALWFGASLRRRLQNRRFPMDRVSA